MRARTSRLPLALLLLLAGCQSAPPARDPGEQSDEHVDYFVRRRVEDALAFRATDRLEPAERQLKMALRLAPENPEALRTLALVLEESGRADEAVALWERADALDPPPPAPPTTPLIKPSAGLVAVLVPPDSAEADRRRLPSGWPDAGLAGAIETHLRARLPGVTVLRADPEGVPQARARLEALSPRSVLSLRVDRAYCGDSAKDGPFGVARVRAAVVESRRVVVAPRTLRVSEIDLRHRAACPERGLLRAVERVLNAPDVQQALLDEPPERGAWPAATLRAAFPGIGVRVAAEIEAGRGLLALGRIRDAERVLGRAERLDPDDPNLRAYLSEARQTLAMARELALLRGEDPDALPESSGSLDPHLTAAQRNVAEALLDRERRDRESLLAALTIFDQDEATLAPDSTLAALRPRPIRDPEAVGPRLARKTAASGANPRTLAPSQVDARSLYAPDGSVLATYYFPAGAGVPVLYEQDSDGDGRADRWTAYEQRTRREMWEDGMGRGRPDVHLVFTEGGLVVERIEIDQDADGRAERVFVYADGRLDRESRDTDADGVLDRIEHFDANGQVRLKEEDLDADGETDVRAYYENNRLTRREVVDPSLLGDLAP